VLLVHHTRLLRWRLSASWRRVQGWRALRPIRTAGVEGDGP